MIFRRLKRALTENRAATAPGHEDPGLRTRTYPVPYDRIWSTTLSVVSQRRGWTLVDADDLDGVIRIEATTPVFRFVDDMEIRIGLDRDGQTRVNARSASRVGGADLGKNARRIRRFFRDLEERLEEGARQPRLGRWEGSSTEAQRVS